MSMSYDKFRSSVSRFTSVSEEVQLHKADRVTNRERVRSDIFSARNLLRARRERKQRHNRHKLKILRHGKLLRPIKLISTRFRVR